MFLNNVWSLTGLGNESRRASLERQNRGEQIMFGQEVCGRVAKLSDFCVHPNVPQSANLGADAIPVAA